MQSILMSMAAYSNLLGGMDKRLHRNWTTSSPSHIKRTTFINRLPVIWFIFTSHLSLSHRSMKNGRRIKFKELLSKTNHLWFNRKWRDQDFSVFNFINSFSYNSVCDEHMNPAKSSVGMDGFALVETFRFNLLDFRFNLMWPKIQSNANEFHLEGN